MRPNLTSIFVDDQRAALAFHTDDALRDLAQHIANKATAEGRGAAT